MQDAGGELPDHDGPFIGLLQGGHGGARLDVPAVDKKVLHGAVGAAGGGFAGEAVDMHAAEGVIHRQQTVRKLLTENGVDTGSQLTVAGGEQLFPAVPDKTEGHLRMRQGDAIHHARHRIRLADVFFEKFHPGGNIIKQVPYDNCRTLGATGVFQVAVLSTFQGVPGAGGFPCGAGEQFHPGDRRDGGQRLAAEAQGADGLQILLAAHFAGGMAQEGGRHVFPGDPRAVVRDADVGDAAVLNLHSDHGGAGVDGVFQQLLDHGGGAFHHLPGGDQLGGMLVEYLNVRHGLPPFLSSRQYFLASAVSSYSFCMASIGVKVLTSRALSC